LTRVLEVVDSSPPDTARNQTIFSTFVLGLGLVFLLALNASALHAGFTLQTIFALGVLVATLGLTAALFQRPLLLAVACFALTGIGMAALLLLTVCAIPRLDWLLFASGEWTDGPIPLSLGWAHLGMSLLLVASGVTLPLARASRPIVVLSALTIVRLTLWCGVFWQLAYLDLHGEFGRLFDGPTVTSLQVGIVASMLIAWPFLLRGDRRWIGALTGRDNSVALSRFILPVAMLPAIGAYLVRSWSNLGGHGDDVSPLLNVEISSAGLLLLGSAALRALWIERRQRGILAQALQRSLVMVRSPEGLIEYWPLECELLFGYSAAEAVGRRPADLLKTEFQAPFAEVEAAIRTDGEWSGEALQITRDGRGLWIASRLVIVRPYENEAARIVETLTDISDLKQAITALEETTESLTQAVATYELGLIEFDPAATRVSFSPQFERIAGAQPGLLEQHGDLWNSLLAPDDADRLREWFALDVRDQVAERSLDIHIKRLDGEIRNLSGRLRYRYNSTGALLRLVGIFRDVTEQVRDRAEVELRGARLLELQSELTHTSRLSAMGEMAAALAHELNQPLTAVANSVGAIEMMLKDSTRPVDETKRQQVLRAARHAEGQAVRAGEIIRRLREFISRGEADTSAQSLGRLIDDALALALPNPTATGIQIEKAIAAGATKVIANRVQIQQVMVNLVRNAAESMRGQFGVQRISVDVTTVEGMAIISITDSGPGVSLDLVDQLFSPFVSTKPDGMGVGLSICRRIVEAHGGKLWFEVHDGLGARFKFTLPLVQNG
jgi:two-component system sensor kinase FixL